MDHLQQTVGEPLTEEQTQALYMEYGYRDSEPVTNPPAEPPPQTSVVKNGISASPQNMVRNKFETSRELPRRVSDRDHPPNCMDVEFTKTPSGSTATGAMATTTTTAATTPQPEVPLQHAANGEVRRHMDFADELITEDEMRRFKGGRSAAMVPPPRPSPEESATEQPEWLRAMKTMFDNQGDRMDGDVPRLGQQDVEHRGGLGLQHGPHAAMHTRFGSIHALRHRVEQNKKQDQKFGEELRRIESKMEALATTPHNNLQGIEKRLMRLEAGDKLDKKPNDAGKRPRTRAHRLGAHKRPFSANGPMAPAGQPSSRTRSSGAPPAAPQDGAAGAVCAAALRPNREGEGAARTSARGWMATSAAAAGGGKNCPPEMGRGGAQAGAWTGKTLDEERRGPRAAEVPTAHHHHRGQDLDQGQQGGGQVQPPVDDWEMRIGSSSCRRSSCRRRWTS